MTPGHFLFGVCAPIPHRNQTSAPHLPRRMANSLVSCNSLQGKSSPQRLLPLLSNILIPVYFNAVLLEPTLLSFVQGLCWWTFSVGREHNGRLMGIFIWTSVTLLKSHDADFHLFTGPLCNHVCVHFYKMKNVSSFVLLHVGASCWRVMPTCSKWKTHRQCEIQWHGVYLHQAY